MANVVYRITVVVPPTAEVKTVHVPGIQGPPGPPGPPGESGPSGAMQWASTQW
ncbi:hypothetical protein [Halomonas alkaliantarctica]|uniref:hypothetical protein n=1 Tax=Halomonas alkaliantarctica TaxID=232346 RepID=UPI00265841CE|nr:hypothetical protein [Halomonas alkaliantarctica]